MTTDPGPSTPTRRPIYEASSQFRSWRFSANQLQHTRTVLNADAVAAIKSAFETDLVCYCRLFGFSCQLKSFLLSNLSSLVLLLVFSS